MLKLIRYLIILSITFSTIATYGAEPLDRIVAQANNDVITQSQLDKAVEITKAQLSHENKPFPDEKTLVKQVLNQLIDTKLQLQVAERAKIKITDAELTKSIADIANKNHMTVNQLKEALAQQGMNFDTYRHQIREQMTIAYVQRQVLGPEIKITDEEVNAFLQSPQAKNVAGSAQYRLIDVLIPLPDNATPNQVEAAKKQADEIAAQLRNGTDINQLKVPSTDLGMRPLVDIPSVLAKAVVGLKIGGITNPIQAPNGFHVLQLVDKKNAPQMNTEQARQILTQQKVAAALQKWVQQLRSTAYIKIML